MKLVKYRTNNVQSEIIIFHGTLSFYGSHGVSLTTNSNVYQHIVQICCTTILNKIHLFVHIRKRLLQVNHQISCHQTTNANDCKVVFKLAITLRQSFKAIQHRLMSKTNVFYKRHSDEQNTNNGFLLIAPCPQLLLVLYSRTV